MDGFLSGSGTDGTPGIVSGIDLADGPGADSGTPASGRCPAQRRTADVAVPETHLNDDFAGWFSEGGSDLLLRSAHSLCGRHIYEDIAFEAAATIYRQWGDPRKRHLFKTQTGYVFQVVRNTFLSHLRKAGNRPGLHQELPGEENRAFWKKVAEDPGYEVRQAILLLDPDEAELVFIRYFLNLTLSATARDLGLKRSAAEKLHNKALDELRDILGPEGAG
jgi:RNA polymerase sigma factor (sigma-70 family)